MKPILSLNDLAFRAGVSLAELRRIAADIERDPASHYDIRIKVSGTKVRHFRVPKSHLKGIQRRIAAALGTFDIGPHAHGGIRGRSPRTNAQRHLGSRCVVNLDVRNFFPSARHYAVYRTFRHELGFGRDVARLLTRLSTVDSQIPQGAPTSTVVSNLLLGSRIDMAIADRARQSGIRYTRFVDDITLSGDNPRDLINFAACELSKKRLSIHRVGTHTSPKHKITPQRHRQTVTGLVVNSKDRASVSREYRDRVRAAIHGLAVISDPAALERTTRSIVGRIAHIRQFNPGAAARLERYLRCVHG